MLVKIPNAPLDLVQELKDSTGAVTASKAFMAAARSHEPMKAKIIELSAEIDLLKARLTHSEEVIASARSAASSLLGTISPVQKRPASLKDLGEWFDAQASLELNPHSDDAAAWEAAPPVGREFGADLPLVKGRDPGSS
ncbi:hypothetical protein [Pseudomonas laurylsulfatiphila]|uniref:hypothetical protein n=1 Tax=Pseudomonas laurylsulfatiphila TaxID=2011015 RepID=UPI003D1F72AA|nr:hypothetical protein [Pseudomonas reinekei]MDF9902041.1 hypothetical protein [Pseudomonas reinekei]